ncbi:hypothetical protein GE21DRAFT_1009930 [Neurospora crassa]|nr:hypothetical protein GE21DRAFT_1009930 [Neurospora crassa]
MVDQINRELSRHTASCSAANPPKKERKKERGDCFDTLSEGRDLDPGEEARRDSLNNIARGENFHRLATLQNLYNTR